MPSLGAFRYGESELEPAVQAEILFESARNEARVAILEILLAILFGVFWMDVFRDPAFMPLSVFVLLTVVPLLVDSGLRRQAARRLLEPAKTRAGS